MCTINHNVAANQLLAATTDNININQQNNTCIWCESKAIVKPSKARRSQNIGDLQACHDCLVEHE